MRAGANAALAKIIMQYISGNLYESIKTLEIYKMVLSALAGRNYTSRDKASLSIKRVDNADGSLRL